MHRARPRTAFTGAWPVIVLAIAAACAAGQSSTASTGGTFVPNEAGGGGNAANTADGAGDDSGASGASGGSGGGSGGASGGASGGVSNGASSGGSSGTSGDDAGGDAPAQDDATSSGSSGTSSGSSSSASSSGTGGSSSSSGGTTPTCVTTLSPAPVCDSRHQYCLCNKDSQCNSGGTNIGNPGGCHQSSRCSPQSNCTGGQFADSVGCSIVSPFCNLGGQDACPANTVCEVNHGNCGGSIQCCWCTSDSGCPVSGKCINDATQNQCSGKGPCSGTGTNWDGMHCELTSPGIPMCTLQ
jgi:hypothetical protein